MLAIDYSWTHPNPGAIKRAGYSGVLRYLSNDRTKNLTGDEVRALHRAGLWVAVVWEATSNRAAQGVKAGNVDRRKAERMAKALGYPKECPIFYAVDFDAEPRVVRPYFHGINEHNTHPVGGYGSLRVVDDLVMTSGIARYGWQTVAWSGGGMSEHAHIYQRAKATHVIQGVKGGFDEDVILKAFPVWAPAVPAPAPKPPAGNPDGDLVAAFHKWMSEKGLTS